MTDKVLVAPLFVPGNNERKLQKALSLSNNLVIIDLEDTIPPNEKEITRDSVRNSLNNSSRKDNIYIRVNALNTRWALEDIIFALGNSVEGIVLPKMETADQLFCVRWLTQQLSTHHSKNRKSISILPIVESALGVKNIDSIDWKSYGVTEIAFGSVDYAYDMYYERGIDEASIDIARVTILQKARAAGLEGVLDGVSLDTHSTSELFNSASRARELGFTGKLCIHPDQLETVRKAFVPPDDQIKWAKEVVTEFEAAATSGTAALRVRGIFVDTPIYYRAKRILETANL